MSLKKMQRGMILSAAVVAAMAVGGAVYGGNGTWSSTASTGAWETTGNWSALPGATSGTTNGDTATFNNNNTVYVITPDSGRNIKSITFDTLTGSYTMGTASGNALLLSSGGTTQIASSRLPSGTSVSETINCPLQIQNSSSSSLGSYTFSNNALQNNATLNFGGAISGAATSGNTTTLNLSALTIATDTLAAPPSSTISGVIGDGTAGGQLKLVQASGVWTLSGANTYTGGTTVNGGTLIISSDANLGTAPSSAATNISLSYGTLQTTATMTLNSKRSITLPNQSYFNVNAGTTLTVDSVISGAGALYKTGGGNLILGAADTFAGAETVYGGTLTVDFSQPGAPTKDILNNAHSITLAGGALVINGPASGATSQTVLQTTFNAGANAISITNATGTTAVMVMKAINRNLGATVDFTQPTNGAVSTSNGYTTTTINANGILGGWATVGGTDWAVSGASGTNVITALATYAGELKVATAITNVKLNANDVLDSGSTVTANSLNLKSGGQVSMNGSGMTLTSGGILVSGGATSISGGGTITSGNGKDVIFVTTSDLSVDSVITNNGATSLGLTKSGAGTLTLSGANTFTNVTNINAGALLLNNAQALQNSSVSVNVSNGLTFAPGIGTFQIGGLMGSGNVVLGATDNSAVTLQIGSNNSSSTYSGAFSDPSGGVGAITKVGTGKLTLTGVSTYTGALTINNGQVQIQNAGAVNTTGGVTVNSGGTLELNNGVVLGNNIPLTFVGAGTGLVNSGALVSVAGTNILGTATTASVVFNGKNLQRIQPGMTLSLSGDTTIASNGTNDALTPPSISYLVVNANVTPSTATSGTTTLTLRGSSVPSMTNNINYLTGSLVKGNAVNGTLSDNGLNVLAVSKQDVGSWILSDPTNSYSGGTTISGGTLYAVNGFQGSNNGTYNITPLGTGAVTLSGGTLWLCSGNSGTKTIFGSGNGYTVKVTGNSTLQTMDASYFTSDSLGNGMQQLGNLELGAQLTFTVNNQIGEWFAGTTTLMNNNAAFNLTNAATSGNGIGSYQFSGFILTGDITDGTNTCSLTKTGTNMLGYTASANPSFKGGTIINKGAILWEPGAARSDAANNPFYFGTGAITLNASTAMFSLQGTSTATGSSANYYVGNAFIIGSSGGIINVGQSVTTGPNVSNNLSVVQYNGAITLGGNLGLDAGLIVAATGSGTSNNYSSKGVTNLAYFAGTMTVTGGDRTITVGQDKITAPSMRNITITGSIGQDVSGRTLTLVANQNTNLTLAQNVTLGNTISVSNLVIGTTTSGMQGTVIFGANDVLAATSTLTMQAGTKASITAGGNKVLQMAALTMGTGAVLDINDNDLLLHPVDTITQGTAYADLKGKIISTRDNGAWDGTTGLISSNAKTMATNGEYIGMALLKGSDFLALNGTGATFNGKTVVANDVLVKYTYTGDANLDGRITMDDYLAIDSGYLFGGSEYANGDFNYDGSVTAADYQLIDRAYLNQGGTTLGDAVIQLHASWFGEGYLQELTQAVPEPGTVGLLAVGVVGLLARRRK